MTQVRTLDEFALVSERILKTIADTDNSIACEWLRKIEASQTSYQKTCYLGDMRMALRGDRRKEAIAIMDRMYPGG